MKVLHIPTGGLLFDGIYSCIAAYVSHMDKEDMIIDILATNAPESEMIKRIEKLGMGIQTIPFRKKNPVRYFGKLIYLIKKKKYDIVHVHGSSSLMVIELLAAKLAGCKVRIAHSHNTNCEHTKTDKLLRPLFMYLYTHAFACGKDAGYWLFGKKDFTILPNGRNLDLFAFSDDDRKSVRQEWNVDEDTLVIGHVGRFSREKNHQFLLEIFNEIKKKKPDVKLVLVGSGELMEDIRKKMNRYGLSHDIIMTGVVNDVQKLLSGMDIMILPSLYEGLPLVVIEWQMAGLPCVISDKVTDECMIENNVIRISLSEPPAVWAEKILKIRLTDRKLSRDKVKQDMRLAGYDIREGAKKLEKYYLGFTRGK